MSRTKIIATYGPACEAEATLLDMLRAGLDVVRLNVSHLDPENLVAAASRIRQIADKARLPLAILADMPGPKIRLTACDPPAFTLAKDDVIEMAPGKNGVSTPERLLVQYPHLLDDVAPGHEMAINDGLVLVRAETVDRQSGVLRCRVLRGGPVGSRKGVSFLHTTLRISGLTPRDKKGIRAAVQAEVDYIALSFVRSSEDVLAARRILKRAGMPDLPIVAKIEQHEAVDHIDDILEVSDGVMVARGDMGIERPLEEVPLLQKDIIRQANQAGKFVITATQMLESMIENSRPTRAEVSDVANAILDGSDAVMLSAETAMGHAPAHVVETMTRIALSAETRVDALHWLCRFQPDDQRRRQSDPNGNQPDLDDALARATCQLALDARLDAIICLTSSGTTARRIARYRPACDIHALSPEAETCRRLALTWGVEAYAFPAARPDPAERLSKSPDDLIAPAIDLLRRQNKIAPGDKVAFLAGLPLNTPGGTNYLRVIEI